MHGKQRRSKSARWIAFLLFFSPSPPSSCLAFSLADRRRHQQLTYSSPESHKTLINNRKHVWLQQALVPQENPYADKSATSLSGVPYESVLQQLVHKLYPPSDLDQRNALSRTDGYWPYIQKGNEPPKDLTYGEYDFYFFANLLDRAAVLLSQQQSSSSESIQQQQQQNCGWQDKIFADLGSGSGRLCVAAAALHPNWKLCRGIELLQGLTDEANKKLEEGITTLSSSSGGLLPMAPVEFCCGSFEDPYVYFGDADLVFVFSSAMGPELRDGIAKSIGRQCKPGTIVITTDYMLPLTGTIPAFEKDARVPFGEYRLSLLEQVDGWCWLTGGTSTAFIHKVEESLAMDPLEEPQVSLEDKALEVVRAYEAGELTDSKAFLRNVYNEMAFNDIPESFRPKLDDDDDIKNN